MNCWVGHRVRLRALTPDDWAHFDEADQDSGLQRRLQDLVYPPRSEQGTRRMAEELATKPREDDGIFLAVETLKGQFVGGVDAHHCDRRVGTFRYGISISARNRRKGYAREAVALLLRHFFHELRYQKAVATVHAYNEASIALQEGMGFTLEGRLRRMIFTNGQYFDELYFGLTREEFDSNLASSLPCEL